MNLIKIFWLSVVGPLSLGALLASTIPFSIPVLQHELRAEGVYEVVPASRVESELENLTQFFWGRQGLNPLFYTTREFAHLEDVALRVWLLRWLGLIGLGISGWVGAIFVRSGELKQLLRLIRRSTLVWSVGIGITGLVLALWFERLFFVFHQLVFTNSYWLLDPKNEWLVILFPEAVFFRLAMGIAVAWVSVLALAFLIATVVDEQVT